MTTLPNPEKIHHQIDQLRPDQLVLLGEFLDFLTFQRQHPDETDVGNAAPRKSIGTNLDPYLKNALPDCFWLGDTASGAGNSQLEEEDED